MTWGVFGRILLEIEHQGQSKRKETFLTHRLSPGFKTTASKSQRWRLGHSGSKSSTYIVVVANLLNVPRGRAMIHHFIPVRISTYLPSPSLSRCQKWKAPWVAAEAHHMSGIGYWLSSWQKGRPSVCRQAYQSLEKDVDEAPIPVTPGK
jgi:hypothetical protein